MFKKLVIVAALVSAQAYASQDENFDWFGAPEHVRQDLTRYIIGRDVMLSNYAVRHVPSFIVNGQTQLPQQPVTPPSEMDEETRTFYDVPVMIERAKRNLHALGQKIYQERIDKIYANKQK